MRAFFIHIYFDFWIEVAKLLHRETNVNPVYWVADNKYFPQIKKEFPGAFVHDRFSAMRGIGIEKEMNINVEHPDTEAIKVYSEYERIVMQMMDSFEVVAPFVYEERLLVYHRMLGYWLSVTNALKPDVVIFPRVPSNIYNYVLYNICKKNRIKTIMFEDVPFGRVFTTEEIEQGSPITRYYNQNNMDSDNNEKYKLSEEMNDYLKKLTLSYEEAVPFYLKKYYSDKINKKVTK